MLPSRLLLEIYMTFRKTIFTISAALCMALPIQAEAGALTIHNRTAFDSTSITNNASCSSLLGETGITRAGQDKVVSDTLIRTACMLKRHPCKSDVYMTANCTGRKIATVLFDVDTGIVSIVNYPAAPGEISFRVSGSSFETTIEQIK